MKDGPFDWAVTDSMFKSVEDNGLLVRMHALISMTPYYMPGWRDEVKSTDKWWELIDRRGAAVAQRYGTRNIAYYVINETRYQTQFCEKEAPLFPAYDNPGTGVRIFSIARRHLPQSILMPLEHFYPVISEQNSVFRQYLDYCSEMLERKAPLDAVGCQRHYHTFMPSFRDGNRWAGHNAVSMSPLVKGLDHMASVLGKPTQITEFGPPSRNTWNKDPNQARLTDEEVAAWSTYFYTLAFSKPYIREVTRWFVVDGVCGRGALMPGS